MNKEQLEKLFNERFFEQLGNMRVVSPIAIIPEIKDFIFSTIIPEVLKSIIPYKNGLHYEHSKFYDLAIDRIKQKAKDLYGIDL